MFKKYSNYVKYRNHLKTGLKSVLKNNIDNIKHILISNNIDFNMSSIRDAFGKTDDIVIREFKISNKKQTKAFVCFIDGLGDKMLINEHVIKPLMINTHIIDPDRKLFNQDVFQMIKDYALSAVEVEETKSFDIVLNKILAGDTALFIDGSDRVLIISAKGEKTRDIMEPDTEPAVRGPREGFTETLRINTSLLRRKIRNTKLTFEPLELGKQTNTEINIAYIEGIAEKKIVEEVKSRLHRIDIDAILESGYIEQLIDDNPLSPFATIGNSERPDKIAAKLLEGRVAILCSGTPFVLTVPYLFIEALQVTEDYYSRPFLSSILRILRLSAYMISLLLPAFYVALETFHQEMIPTVLLVTAAASREGIPFPSIIETLIMLVIFEILRESGVRLPRQVGQAVSIVGALVIGESAVQAGIISAPMVIIGALTGITSFVIPALLDSVIIFRFFFLFLAAVLGLYGIALGIIIQLAHMCSLRSFGTPYLAPIAPTVWKDLKDSFIRAPLWLMKSRPKFIAQQNTKRLNSKMPSNSKNNGGRNK